VPHIYNCARKEIYSNFTVRTYRFIQLVCIPSRIYNIRELEEI